MNKTQRLVNGRRLTSRINERFVDRHVHRLVCLYTSQIQLQETIAQRRHGLGPTE